MMQKISEKELLESIHFHLYRAVIAAKQLNFDGHGFVIEDRMHEKLQGETILNYLKETLSDLMIEIDKRVSEL